MKCRDIKFRAWVISEKQMLNNGDWFELEVTHPTPLIRYAEQGYWVNNSKADGEHLASLIKNGIEPKDDFVLMQYTGLKDKNGKEVYEGDVIQGVLTGDYQVGTMGTVIFDNEHYVFANENEGGITFLMKISKIEVIGNIFENPELMSYGK